MKNKKIIILSCISILVISISFATIYYINNQKNTTKPTINENVNNNENINNEASNLPGTQLNDQEKKELDLFFGDILNSQMTYINFSTPQDLLQKDKHGYIMYIVSRSKYAKEIKDDNIPTSSIKLNNIKKVLKELTNYDYPEDEIKECFKSVYDKNKDEYVITGGGAGAISEIINSYKIDNRYYIELSNKSKVVLEKTSDNYYFYSCETSENES